MNSQINFSQSGQDSIDAVIENFGSIDFLFVALSSGSDFYQFDMNAGQDSGLVGTPTESVPVVNFGQFETITSSSQYISAQNGERSKTKFSYSEGQDVIDAVIENFGSLEFYFESFAKAKMLEDPIGDFYLSAVPNTFSIDISGIKKFTDQTVTNAGTFESLIGSNDNFLFPTSTKDNWTNYSEGQDVIDSSIQLLGGVEYLFSSKDISIESFYRSDVTSGDPSLYVKTETKGNRTVSDLLKMNTFVVVNYGTPTFDGILSESGFNLLTEDGGKLKIE